MTDGVKKYTCTENINRFVKRGRMLFLFWTFNDWKMQPESIILMKEYD